MDGANHLGMYQPYSEETDLLQHASSEEATDTKEQLSEKKVKMPDFSGLKNVVLDKLFMQLLC